LYDRGNSGVSGERECKRKKNEERENRYLLVLDGRRKGYRMDERDMEKEGHNVKRKGWGLEREMFFFLELLFFRQNCMQESESP
jgi:hypothetical protein